MPQQLRNAMHNATMVDLNNGTDGLCADELCSIIRFLLQESDSSHPLEKGQIRLIRQKLPELFALAGVVLSDDEQKSYTTTLDIAKGKPRYLDWMELQLILANMGVDVTVMNNMSTRRAYSYEYEKSEFNTGNRPHIIVTLQKRHWKGLFKWADNLLHTWTPHEIDEIISKFEMMANITPITTYAVKFMLPLWVEEAEENKKEAEVKARIPHDSKPGRRSARGREAPDSGMVPGDEVDAA